MDALLETAAPELLATCRPGTRAQAGEPPELFSGLSHEICRPLISLRAGFDLLLAGCEGPISHAQREHVQTLRAQCDGLINLTRTYLDYAGLVQAQGPRPLAWASFRLGALLDEADRQFSCKANARGISWTCRLVGDDASVATDLARFQKILGELVANAFNHTPTGGQVDLLGRVETDAWLVEVSDNGRGIPPDVIDRVFDPLVHLNGSPNISTGGGYGMGLTVCRELVTQLGGEITLRSEPDRGTVVTVRFPRERS